jgi:hypothetical protein
MRNCDILGKKEQCANKLIILRRINIRLSVIFVLVLVLSPAEIDYYTAPPSFIEGFLKFFVEICTNLVPLKSMYIIIAELVKFRILKQCDRFSRART